MKRILKKLAFFFMNCLPLNKKLIVFESNPDISDSTYALYLYIRKNYPTYKCVWAIKPEQIKKCKEKKIRYFLANNKILSLFYLSTCKYFLYTHVRIWERKLRKKQFAFEIWHGSPGKRFNKVLICNKENGHIFVTATKYTFEKYRENYDLHSSNYLLCNHPRNDFFDQKFSPYEINKVEDVLHLSQYSKTMIWLPTFKREKSKSCCFLDNFSMRISFDEFVTLNKFLNKNNMLLIIKLHPMVTNSDLSQYKGFSNIFFLSSQDLLDYDVQLYSIIGKCDALISDFSSVVYDFMALDRPIGYVLTDLNSYANDKNEGFIHENIEKFIVGDRIYTLADLKKFINKVKDGVDDYKEERNKLAKLYVGSQEPGKICEFFCKSIGL